MKEFVKEMRDPVETVPTRFAAASTISSLLAPATLVLGLATLLSYDPVVDTMALMGLPSWSTPLIGIIEVAAAVALVVPFASFFGAAAMIAVCIAGAALYLRLAEVGFATVLGVVAVAFIAVAAIRVPELTKRGRRLWSPASV